MLGWVWGPASWVGIRSEIVDVGVGLGPNKMEICCISICLSGAVPAMSGLKAIATKAILLAQPACARDLWDVFYVGQGLASLFELMLFSIHMLHWRAKSCTPAHAPDEP